MSCVVSSIVQFWPFLLLSTLCFFGLVLPRPAAVGLVSVKLTQNLYKQLTNPDTGTVLPNRRFESSLTAW